MMMQKYAVNKIKKWTSSNLVSNVIEMGYNICKRKSVAIWGKYVFRFLYLFIMLFVLSLGIEATVYLFSKAGRLKLTSTDEIVSISKIVLRKLKRPTQSIYHILILAMYIHPAAVFLNSMGDKYPVYMQSNSEGFIDDEFPIERREGLCVYGIMGGSAAMSWGVEKRESGYLIV